MALHHALRAAAQQQAATPADPYFYDVPLLLTGNGTNGAQNNTFLDSSSNNFTVSTSATIPFQGSFSPYGNLWSVGLDGGGDYLTTPSDAALGLSTGDWTIECWINVLSTGGGSNWIIDTRPSGGTTDVKPWIYYYNGVSPYGLRCGFGNSTVITSDVGLNFGAWTHVAVVKASNVMTMYVNGVAQTTTYADTNDYGTTNDVIIGESGANRTANEYFSGNISNVRIVKGTAVYTSNFTPSTTPLTAISGTVLLTCQSNSFIDKSSNNFTITPTGYVEGTSAGPIISKFSPFNPTASYSASTIGGSAQFSGSNYLSVADNAELQLSTNPFTIEAWVYRHEVSAAAEHAILAKGATSTGWLLSITTTNQLKFINGTFSTTTSDNVIKFNCWTHVAAVRTNTSTNGFKLYVNGVLKSTTTVATNFNQTNTMYVGISRNGASFGMSGYISNLRVVNGTAVYTADFTPPTAPVTAVTNTCLLCNFTNAGIFDSAMINDVSTIGDAKISTSVKKYGTGSMAFDGTGDYLTIPQTASSYSNRPELKLGTGPFTIECWVYLNATGVAYSFMSKGTSTTGWSLGCNSTNKIVFNYGSSNITSTGALSSSTWYHIAIVREGDGTNQTKIYIGGTNDGTGTVSTNFNQTSIAYVGASRTGATPLNGYIDDLRITKGLARYTANFTPPTAALPTY